MYKKVEHIPVDGSKMILALKERGANLTEAAEKAGYTQTWLSKAGVRGWLTPPQMVFLETTYGITREEIAPRERDEAKEEIDQNHHTDDDGGILYVANMTQGDLYETIYDAVVAALGGGRCMKNDRTTRWDHLKNMTAREVGHYFCEQFEECGCCPAYERCHTDDGYGTNGFTNWMEETWNE